MNTRPAVSMLVVVAFTASMLLLTAPAGAANVSLKITGSTDQAEEPTCVTLSYSGSVGAASITAKADTEGEAQLKLGFSHSYKLDSGGSGKAVAAATWHRAERPWLGGPGIAAGDWLHIDAGLTFTAPTTSKDRLSAAVDADMRMYPRAQTRNYLQAAASGEAQWDSPVGTAMSVDGQLGAKLMPGNPKWTAVFGSVGLDAQRKHSSVSPSLALAVKGRAYPESMAKSYAAASADVGVEPRLATGHKLEFSAGATAKARPLQPEMSTVAGRASAKWSYTVPRSADGSSSLRPTLSASAATSATRWHNSPEGKSSTATTLKAKLSIPLPGGFSLAFDASWRSSGKYEAADDEPASGNPDDTGDGEPDDGESGDDGDLGFTLGFSAKWTGTLTPTPTVSLGVRGVRSDGAAASASASPSPASAWLIRAEVVASCKF